MNQLQLLFKILGLGSASGLLYQENTIFAIGDNSSYLYQYEMQTNILDRFPLVENASDTISKKQKPDFEAITQYQDSIYIFGSGSTENRNQMIVMDAKTKKVVATNDISILYAAMQSFGNISSDEFNIEGVLHNGNNWLFFNRGNGKKSKNAIFTIGGKNLIDDFSILYNTIKLPKIKGIETSFTDAILVDQKIYFLATAEDTDSTYNDGEILGSIIGTIDLESLKLQSYQIISKTNKLEGIALLEQTKDSISFIICEDNDTEIQESNIYKITLPK